MLFKYFFSSLSSILKKSTGITIRKKNKPKIYTKLITVFRKDCYACKCLGQYDVGRKDDLEVFDITLFITSGA